jgi:hypothetical protein
LASSDGFRAGDAGGRQLVNLGVVDTAVGYQIGGTTVLSCPGYLLLQEIRGGYVGDYHRRYRTTLSWDRDGGGSNTTGQENTFAGTLAGPFNTTGSQNTFFGTQSGYMNGTGNQNTFIGYMAGGGLFSTEGNGNVFLGNFAGYNEAGSNKLYIANSDIDPPLIYGEFDNQKVGINTTDLGGFNFVVGGSAPNR